MQNLKKMIFGLAALVVAFGLVFTASAFKSDAKSTQKAAMYWYEVSYDDPLNYPDGYIKSGTPIFDHAEQDQVESPCDEGNDLDCLRGFDSPITSFPDATLTENRIQKPAN